MTPEPDCAAASLTVSRFLEGELFQAPRSAFPLTVGDPTPVGLVTLDRIRLVAPATRDEVRLRDIMYPLEEVATAAPETPATELVTRFARTSAHRALVMQQGRLICIVSPSDVSRALDWAALGGR